MKIQPNELRIGNYVNYFGRIVEVKGVTSSTLWCTDACDSMAFIDDSTLPIPITKEWLLKLGGRSEPIEEDNYEYITFEINGFNLSADSSNYFTTLENNNFKPVKFIHQLQNLYFALTGKELKCYISKIS